MSDLGNQVRQLFLLLKKAKGKLLVSAAWLAVVTLLRWQFNFSIFFLWLGAFVGTFLVDLDHLLYLLDQPLLGEKTKTLLVQKKLVETIALADQTRPERTKLVFHSALFQVLLQFVTFFVLTSTASLFGAGLVMAMSLHLVRSEVELLLSKQNLDSLFWQFKGEISPQNQRLFVIVMFLLFVFLTLLLI